MDRKSVFISHTEEEVARDLQAVLMHAFPDQIKPFNSAEAQQGLSSGVKIEDAILDSIERAELFISLWTPDSLESPAWMAWELGAARARDKPILVGRALGVQSRQLPVSLSSRAVSDLGTRDALRRFVDDAADALQSTVDVQKYEEYLRQSSPPFYERRSKSAKLRVSLHGRYLFVENVSGEALANVRAVYDEKRDGGPLAVPLALDRAFAGQQRNLDANGRLVAALPRQVELRDLTHDPETVTSEHDLARLGEAALKVQWLSHATGREWMIVRVLDEEAR